MVDVVVVVVEVEGGDHHPQGEDQDQGPEIGSAEVAAAPEIADDAVDLRIDAEAEVILMTENETGLAVGPEIVTGNHVVNHATENHVVDHATEKVVQEAVKTVALAVKRGPADQNLNPPEGHALSPPGGPSHPADPSLHVGLSPLGAQSHLVDHDQGPSPKAGPGPDLLGSKKIMMRNIPTVTQKWRQQKVLLMKLETEMVKMVMVTGSKRLE